MIISLNWLKKYVPITLPVHELVARIGARLVEIENTTDYGDKYKGVTIARIVYCSKLEDSDHLNVVMLDDNGVVADVARDEAGYVQVVCGAPNVRQGMLVAWLPPGTTVPETFTKDPFVLEARKLRGVVSQGMIASAKELDLFDDHSGILELGEEVSPGQPFAEQYDLDDVLLNVENKSLTHRPDTFGIIGFAREIAGITGQQFVTPDWLKDTVSFSHLNTSTSNIRVTIDDPNVSARYQAIVVSGVKKAVTSPLWMQTYLARSGVRPINAVVDVTNYLMLLTGQPLHAFDYDKLLAVGDGKVDIHVRHGRGNGDLLTLLDGREITLDPSDIVVANGSRAIALAGAMGGAATEIDDTTENVIIESATFNLYNLRTTQMRHGIFSEAITRFTKGQPATLTQPVLAEAVRMINELTGSYISEGLAEAYPVQEPMITLDIHTNAINDVLGKSFSSEAIANVLTNVEFVTHVEGTKIHIEVPYWRSDIHQFEDVAEEVGRLSGYDGIEPTLPLRPLAAVMPSSYDAFRANVRHTLAQSGANEVLTYSFVHGDVLRKANLDIADSYRLVNSISPDLQYFRQTLTPSVLQLIHLNIKSGFSKFSIFEMNKTHSMLLPLTDENVPSEIDMLSFVFASKDRIDGSPFYQAKSFLSYLATVFSVELRCIPLDEPDYLLASVFEQRRSAFVVDALTGTKLGIIGEYKKSVHKNFKLPDSVAGFEVYVEKLYLAAKNTRQTYVPVSRYPSTSRDICFEVAADITYDEVMVSLKDAIATDCDIHITPLDIYESTATANVKRITLRVQLTPWSETLTGEKVNAIALDAATKAAEGLHARIV